MKKQRFLAFALVLLVLFSIAACKRDEANEGPNGTDPTPPVGEGDAEGGALGDTLFWVRFEAEAEGFDTAAGTLRTASGTVTRDFSGDLAGLYDRMNECNAFKICLEATDLTYRTLSGGSEPAGENKLYTITFIADDVERVITIDDAAIRAYATSNSNVSNINALIIGFSNTIAFWNGTFS